MRRAVIAAALGLGACGWLVVAALGAANIYTGDPPVYPGTVDQDTAAPVVTLAAQPQGFFAGAPAGESPTCPTANQWRLLYWRGTETRIAAAAAACATADRFWTNVGGRWSGYAVAAPPEANDDFPVLTGQAVFVHGSAQQTGVTLTGILTIIFGDPPPGSGLPPGQRVRLVDDQGQMRDLLVDAKTSLSGPLIGLNGRRVRVVGEAVSEPAGAVRAISIELER